jgi:hypothetical protein
VRGLGGWAKHIQICLRLSADRIVLRPRSPFDYGARGFNVITLLPLVEFSKGDANQKLPFLFSPFGGGVGGGAGQRNGRKFLGLPARVRERGWGAFQRNRGVRVSSEPPRARRV